MRLLLPPQGNYEAYVALGGGSTIDTAKAAKLNATYPDDFLAYVNAPIGQGKPVPGPVKPLIAIPTTARTGSETTGVAIFDLTDRHIKTGIAHRHFKADIRPGRSRQYEDDASGGCCSIWFGCVMSCLRILYRDSF
ncbi:MAG: iron-containing alcohol dehydrogenase [Saprospiraceae bacterium]|nr:iron-containing alcohol dehydrogenase [Saprospiraceae bacterium]